MKPDPLSSAESDVLNRTAAWQAVAGEMRMTDVDWQARTQAWRQRLQWTTCASEQNWQAFGQFKAGIIGRKGEQLVADELARLDVTALHDVILPVEEGLTQVDHLALGQNAVMVIETKTCRGHITGSPNAGQWVQQLADGVTSHVFQNPLRQNRRRCRAVEAVPSDQGVPVLGCVVSAGGATFADELTDLVVPLANIDLLFSSAASRPMPRRTLMASWVCLTRAAGLHEVRRDDHRAALAARQIAGNGR